ncbi:hypothetical protein Poly41_40590 [Novipirellula artificiosorum]|uniref:Uncharacterized protein n=1 Tax=Novipirellula artificiosorum TaxID=2528016 RepID=A0A5C6DJ19_9BACT|nr:hypothetical protein Poly41_40590 [Novipirellula artificiosorum]
MAPTDERAMKPAAANKRSGTGSRTNEASLFGFPSGLVRLLMQRFHVDHYRASRPLGAARLRRADGGAMLRLASEQILRSRRRMCENSKCVGVRLSN